MHRLPTANRYPPSGCQVNVISEQGRNPNGFCTPVELVEEGDKTAYQNRELCTGTLSLLPSWIQSNLPLLEYFGKDIFENKVCLFSSTVREIIKIEIALQYVADGYASLYYSPPEH
jgi:hypothetical protein